jgi:serine/threonine protein phosphatase PrpC
MSESPPLTLRVGAKAHAGKVREENQDRISRFRSPFGEVFIVADGMGGHEGGAKAAEMLVNGLEKYLADLPPQTPPEQALQTAAARINTDIYQRAGSGEPKTAKMGATSVLALVDGRRVLIAHAGDSRAYLLRDGRLSRLTRDHTVVQRMLDKNMLNEEEARHHPDASVVTRAFGQKPEVELEVSAPFELRDGDRVLLCSDGLCGYVEDAAIERVLLAGGDAQTATDALIDLALQAGGEDNVSVQLLATPGSSPSSAGLPAALPMPLPAATAAPQRRFLRPAAVGALLVLAVLAGALIPWKSVLRVKHGQEKKPVPQSGEKAHEKEAPKPNQEKPGRDSPAGQDTPAGTGRAAGGLQDDQPPANDDQGQDLEIYLVGHDEGHKLEDLLADYGNVSVFDPISVFQEGLVYYREDAGEPAREILKELNQEIPHGPRRYALKKWPRELADSFKDAQIVVALRPAAKAQAARTAPAHPRLVVRLTTGSKAPPSPGNVTKNSTKKDGAQR